jgi:CubicO group peptidase (beta-lactamase class C family)
MKSKIITVLLLVFVFFFWEIAISFSYKNSDDKLSLEDNISFALKLNNKDSDYPSTKGVDLLMESFLARNKIKGASVAITYKEKLVYSKGFGIANTETGDSVQPGHLFRIASISKLITAVAILKLYENGRCTLDDRVFGPSGILNDSKFLIYNDPRIENITIRNLLNHTAGWSKTKGDPIFNPLYVANKMKAPVPVNLDVLIEFSLSQKLGYTPGKHYSYSNFGYAVLGKVIEKVSGMPYEDYVIMNILKPLDIKDMHIGKSFYHEKYPNEVMYFEPAGSEKCLCFDGSGQMGSMAYGGNDIELLGAAGGWVASAPELVKFMSAIDGFSAQPDILSKETIKMMTDPETAGSGLYGWRGTDNRGTWWRTGSLSGAIALIVRQDNGVNWVVLLNSSSYHRNRIHSGLSRTMFTATYKTKVWPDINLFYTLNQNTPYPIASIPPINPEL